LPPRGGQVQIPDVSIEQPEDIGLRAHANIRVLVPSGGMDSIAPPSHAEVRMGVEPEESAPYSGGGAPCDRPAAPSAAPIILMYARVGRQAAIAGTQIATSWFVAGYFLTWTGFSFVATLVQWRWSARSCSMPRWQARATRSEGSC
jgi:hypothetical protein